MDNGQNLFRNWQELQKSLFNQIPHNVGNHGFDKYVHKAISHFMQNSLPHQPVYNPFTNEESVEYDLFESQRIVYVRCKAADLTSNHKIRFFATKNKLKIEYPENTQEIKLPCDINPIRAYARMDGDVVEVLLPKSRGSDPYHEIMIRDIN